MKKVTCKVGKIKEYLPHREVEKQPCALATLLHDLGLAVWFGGSLMGILAVNPAVEVLDDPEERGKMVDEAWARFQPFGALGLLTAFVTHVMIRRRGPLRPTQCYKTAAMIQDVAMVGAIASSVASLALGEYAMTPDLDSYTPIDGAAEAETEPAPSGLSPAAWGQIASGLLLFGTAAYMAKERFKSK